MNPQRRSPTTTPDYDYGYTMMCITADFCGDRPSDELMNRINHSVGVIEDGEMDLDAVNCGVIW